MPATRSTTFPGPREKADFLDAGASLDARSPYVRDFALRLAKSRDPNDFEGIARLFFVFVRDSIRYVRDPSWEELADSETILRRGADDCDGKARLFVALCRAVGGPGGLEAAILPRFEPHPDDFVHVQAVCRWPGCETTFPFLCEPWGNGEKWVFVELIVRGVDLGQTPDKGTRGPGGKLLLS